MWTVDLGMTQVVDRDLITVMSWATHMVINPGGRK